VEGRSPNAGVAARNVAGSGPPLKLVHGFTGSCASWGAPVLEGLAAAGLAPVPLDLPGHGHRSGETDPARFQLAAALACIDEAGGAGPLVGYSMGGRIALHYAVRYPERVTHLVLESASPGLASAEDREERRSADEALARRLEHDGIEAFVDRWERLPIFESQAALPDAERTRVRALRLANDASSLAASLRGLGTGALPSLWNRLPKLHVPTLLVVGALDEKFVAIAERMADALPRAALVVVPGAGHAVHLERPDAWLSAVVGFLGRPR
jgi:2-succinyl-6-hydroxy-2,4-cyclohexadiene-1-carboxylate synthase